jgi:hypothetical protein
MLTLDAPLCSLMPLHCKLHCDCVLQMAERARWSATRAPTLVDRLRARRLDRDVLVLQLHGSLQPARGGRTVGGAGRDGEELSLLGGEAKEDDSPWVGL